MAKKVLVVDDEKLIVKGIRFSLEQDGMEVDCAYDGEEALAMIQSKEYDIILLDVMLPKKDGFEVCQHIREFSNMPIVMLTAKGDDMDKIMGLEYGADDYITKPFGTEELMARIRAVLRSHRYSEKNESNHGGDFRLQDLMIDYNKRQVFIDRDEIDLTQTEYNILTFLSIHAGKVLTYAAIIQAVWGYSDYGSVKKLQVNMKNIRKKMGVTPGEKRYIVNELGVGYRMLAEDEE